MMNSEQPESGAGVLEPSSLMDRLDLLCGTTKQAAPDSPFELYHRASITVRVARNLPGGPDEVQVGRDDGVALRVADRAAGQTVFVASSGCDESVVSWLVKRARGGYGTTGGARWEMDGPTQMDHDPSEELPASSELRAWIDRSVGRLRRESSPPSRARVESAFIVESWATSDGFRASRSRARNWAMLEGSGIGYGGAPLVIASRLWRDLDEGGWRKIADDLRWPTDDSTDQVSGNVSLVFSPEAAAALVGLLVRGIHGPHASPGLDVGPGWNVCDSPLEDSGLLGSKFDDTGHVCRNRPLSDGKRALSVIEGPGTLRRGSFRDPPSPRASQLIVAPREARIPERAVIVSGLRVHVLAPNSWILECHGGLLERGTPGRRIRGLCVKTDPVHLVGECLGTWGEARDSHFGIRTPALIFSDRRR